EMMRSLARADRDYGRENEERARKIEWALRQRLDQERQAAERTRAAREEYNKWAYPPGTPDPSPPGPGPGHQSPPPSVAYDVNEQLAKLLNANGNAPDVRPNGDNVFRQVGQDGKPTFEILYQSPNWPTQYHRVVVFAGGRSTSYSPPGSTWPPPEQNDSADSRSGDNTGGRNQGGRNQRGAGNDGGAGTGNDSANGGRSGGGNSGSVYYGGGGRSNPDNTHVFGYASSASDQTAKKSAYNLCSAQGRNCRLDRLIMSHPGYYGAIVVDAANGAYGYAPDYPTQRAATDSARSRCYAAGGKNCSFEITVPPNSWGAVYKGDK
ncbi:MAG: DUF4189 domain-containing protein, partial [Pyrinomonadaceae bacterium]